MLYLKIDSQRLHTPTKERAAELVRRIDRPLGWIAKRSGISERRLRYILDGFRVMPGGKRIDVALKYPEQVTLECMALMVEQSADWK